MAHCCLRKGPHTKNRITDAVVRFQQNPPQKWFLVGCTAYPLHDSSKTYVVFRLVQAMPAWSVHTRRLPSKDCSDARVCGDVPSTMHTIEYTPCGLPRRPLLPAVRIALTCVKPLPTSTKGCDAASATRSVKAAVEYVFIT